MANTGAIKAGSAFVQLFSDNKALNKGLDDASKRLKEWGSSIATVGAGVFAAGTAGLAAAAQTAFAFTSAAVAAGQMSARSGIAVGPMSALALAAERFGGSAEGMEHSLLHMSQLLTEAASGSREATEAFGNLHLSAASLVNLSPDEAFKSIATAVSNIKNPIELAARAQKIFGRGVLDMLPLLKQGGAGISELQRHFDALHLTTSATDVAKAMSFNAAWQDLSKSFKKVGFEIGSAVLPMFEALAKEALPFVTRSIEWVKANQGLVLSLVKGAAALAGFGAAIVGVGAGIYLLGGALSALSMLFSPGGLIVVGIAGIAGAVALGAVAFFKYSEAGQQALTDLKATALDAWGGISDAIQAGDIGAAFDVVLAGLGLAWEQTWGKMARYFKDTWSDLKFVFMNTIGDMILSSGFLTKALLAYGTTVDKILNKIGAIDDAELAKRLERAEFAANMAGNESGLKTLRDAVMKNADKTHAGEHEANADEFDKDLADARARLDAANAAARAARERSRRPGEFPEPGAAGDFHGAVKADTAGTFAGLAASRLGGGTTDSAAMVLNTATLVQRMNRLIQIAEQGGFAVA